MSYCFIQVLIRYASVTLSQETTFLREMMGRRASNTKRKATAFQRRRERREIIQVVVTRCRKRVRPALEITLKSMFGESCRTGKKWRNESRSKIGGGGS